MFTAWLFGFIGTLIAFFGGVVLTGGIFLGLVGSSVWPAPVIFGILFLGGGSYLKYLSRQTVRTR